MATLSKLGPGLLTIGATGTTKELGTHVSELTLEPDFDKDDDINVLSGDTYGGDETETWQMKVNLYQDYSAESLILWTHQNKGQELPFTFVPDKAGKLQAKGTLIVRPASIGGEVKKRNTSEIEFPVIGAPKVTADFSSVAPTG